MILSSAWMQLHPLEPSHRGLYRALYCSADVMRWIGPPLTTQQADAQFARVLAHNRSAYPGHRAWAIETSGAPAEGVAALFRAGGRAELGLMLLPSAWGRRVATRAFELLLPYAFDEMGVHQVDASCTDDGQLPVITQLLARFGFERAVELRPGELSWCLLRSTWISRLQHDREVCS